MGIRPSYGVLESLVGAVMLRKLDEQNRNRIEQKQSHFFRMKHTNVGTCRTDRR